MFPTNVWVFSFSGEHVFAITAGHFSISFTINFRINGFLWPLLKMSARVVNLTWSNQSAFLLQIIDITRYVGWGHIWTWPRKIGNEHFRWYSLRAIEIKVQIELPKLLLHRQWKIAFAYSRKKCVLLMWVLSFSLSSYSLDHITLGLIALF